MKKFEWPDELKFIENRMARQHQCHESMAGKTCVITGATSGVGLEAARTLASRGARLVLVCRNPGKGEKVRQEIISRWAVEVQLVTADFSDLEQVRQAAAIVLDSVPHLDVLINCAGLHSTRYTETAAGIETVFCVNHLASFLFTQLLLDLLKASSPARIIQINSEGHRFSTVHLDDLNWKRHHYTGLKGYGASKTAQLLTVWHFADLLQGTQVTINAMHPGDVRTNIGQNNGWLYRAFSRCFIRWFLKDPVISGEAICYLASAPELGEVSGRFFNLTLEEKPAAHALDRELGERVWAASMKMTGLVPTSIA